MGVDARIRFLVLFPQQGCTIRRLVSLARPRRLAEPDLVQNSICQGAPLASAHLFLAPLRHWLLVPVLVLLPVPALVPAPALSHPAALLRPSSDVSRASPGGFQAASAPA